MAGNQMNPTIKLLATLVLTIGITACGGGSSDSGGGASFSREIVRCVSSAGSILTNNCNFNVNIRYFTSSNTNPPPSETIVEVGVGATLNVGPFAGERIAGWAACQAPGRPTVIYQSTSITCE